MLDRLNRPPQLYINLGDNVEDGDTAEGGEVAPLEVPVRHGEL